MSDTTAQQYTANSSSATSLLSHREPGAQWNDIDRRQQSERWDQFLQSIRENISLCRPPWNVFLSYAWEQDEAENEQLQMWLQRVQHSLKAAGAADVFLDLTHAMRSNIASADVMVIACTPRYFEQAQTSPSSVEVLEEHRKHDLQIIPVLVKGSMKESVPAQLQDFTVRDSTRCSFEDLMTELTPLGIIPGILGCGAGGTEYTPLLQHFQLTKLPIINPGFVGRVAVLETLHSQLAATTCVTLSGLGGIGKTQTAFAFAYKFESEYAFCRWLTSGTAQMIEIELEQLARKLKVKVDNKEKSMWMTSLFEKLMQIDKWLLVFDNVESIEDISPFLPKLLKPGQHIIMTSRSQQFASILSIDVMDQAEVDELLRVHLKGSTVGNFTPDDSFQLGERLGRLPLALSHATAYMRTHGVNIPTYLELLDKIPENLLIKYDGNDLVNYPRSVRSTCLLSLEKIISQSADAMTMLNHCAWMHADNIPLVWFEQEGIFGDVSRAVDALDVLRKYSMVSNGADGSKTIEMHRLVQDLLLSGQSEETKKEVIEGQIGAVMSLFPRDMIRTQEEGTIANMLVPHLQRITEVSEKIFPGNVQVTSIMYFLSNIYHQLGHVVWQKDLMERALKINEEYYGPGHVEVAKTLTILGNTYGSLGRPAKQKELLERALKIEEEHFGSDSSHFEVAKTLANLGNSYGSMGQPLKKKELLERALKIQEEQRGLSHIEIAQTLANLGNTYGSMGQPLKKKDLLERALKIKEEHYGLNHFEIAKALANLGNAYSSLGLYDKAKELLERALKIKEDHYGPNHFEVAATLASLGNTYGDLGQPEQQKMLLERALKIKEQHYGPNHFEVAKTLINLGNAYSSLDIPCKQKELLERALKIEEEHYGPDHFEVAITLGNLGNAFGALGQSDKKKELLERALKIEEQHYGPRHVEVAITLTNLGNAYGSLGQPLKKRELLERALKIQEEHYGSSHFEVAVTLVHLGNAYGDLGQPLKKKELLERALKIQAYI